MTSNTPIAISAIAGTAASSTFFAPMTEIFDGLALALFICGAMGGLGFVLAQKRPMWKTLPRRMILGGLFAGGFSILAPVLFEKMIGVELTPDAGGTRLLAACAFGVGFLQDALIEFVKRGKGGGDAQG